MPRGDTPVNLLYLKDCQDSVLRVLLQKTIIARTNWLHLATSQCLQLSIKASYWISQPWAFVSCMGRGMGEKGKEIDSRARQTSPGCQSWWLQGQHARRSPVAELPSSAFSDLCTLQDNKLWLPWYVEPPSTLVSPALDLATQTDTQALCNRGLSSLWTLGDLHVVLIHEKWSVSQGHPDQNRKEKLKDEGTWDRKMDGGGNKSQIIDACSF